MRKRTVIAGVIILTASSALVGAAAGAGGLGLGVARGIAAGAAAAGITAATPVTTVGAAPHTPRRATLGPPLDYNPFTENPDGTPLEPEGAALSGGNEP